MQQPPYCAPPLHMLARLRTAIDDPLASAAAVYAMVAASITIASEEESAAASGEAVALEGEGEAPALELPREFHACTVDHLAVLIVDMLERLLAHNDRLPGLASHSASATAPTTDANDAASVAALATVVVDDDRRHLTRFHSRAPPAITLSDYLARIIKYTAPPPAVLLSLLLYCDRAAIPPPSTVTGSDGVPAPATFTSPLAPRVAIHINSLTVHRFLIAACLVATKWWCDSYHTNGYYARVGGVSAQELNGLEVELVLALRWRLGAEEEELQRYYTGLVMQHPRFTLAAARAVPVVGETDETSRKTRRVAAEDTAASPSSPRGTLSAAVDGAGNDDAVSEHTVAEEEAVSAATGDWKEARQEVTADETPDETPIDASEPSSSSSSAETSPAQDTAQGTSSPGIIISPSCSAAPIPSIQACS